MSADLLLLPIHELNCVPAR